LENGKWEELFYVNADDFIRVFGKKIPYQGVNAKCEVEYAVTDENGKPLVVNGEVIHATLTKYVKSIKVWIKK